MLNCFQCNSPIAERGFFCKSCGIQIKCKNCNDFLEPDSTACIMCGTLLTSEVINHEVKPVSQTMNTFEFRETRNERTAKATLTNASVESLRETLSLVVSSYPLANIVKKQTTKQSDLTPMLFPDIEENGDGEKMKNITPKEIPQIGNETTQKLRNIFYLDDGKLILEIQDLKASGQKDFGIRLVYLRLLYSKEVEAKEYILREDLNETLKEVMGFLDPNVLNWISITNDLALKSEGGKTLVRLKADGCTKALKVLGDIDNEELDSTFIPEKRQRNTSKNQSAKLTETQKTTKSPSRKGKPKSKYVEDWISKWKELNLGIDLHGIAKELSVSDRIVLALWVIYKSTNGAVDSATTYKISPIMTNLLFVSGNRANLDKTLKNGYKDMIQKTPDGWRITPTGIKHAEGKLGLTNTSSKSKK